MLSVVFASEQSLVKAGSLGIVKGSQNYFKGEVSAQRLFNKTEFNAFSGALVRFSKGARTAWHTHGGGQTLIVTKGVIYSGDSKGVVQVARAGDILLCPPSLAHYHAGFEEEGEHIALTNAAADGKNAVWVSI